MVNLNYAHTEEIKHKKIIISFNQRFAILRAYNTTEKMNASLSVCGFIVAIFYRQLLLK